MYDESKGIHQNNRGGGNKPAGGANAPGTAGKGQVSKTKPPFRKYNKYKNITNHANNVTGGADDDEKEPIVQCYVCQQLGDLESNACLNGGVEITMSNCKYEKY